MHKVIINGETVYASDGQLLSDLLIEAGKAFEHPCGGKGTCRKCLVTVNASEELSCQYRIKSDIVVYTESKNNIVSVSGASESAVYTDNICLVLDIGTTTLALALVSLDEKRIIRVITADNPQRIYGADVISRIDYCRRNGPEELNKVLISEVNSMISELDLKKAGDMYVAGNTTMLHLFFGVDCSSIGVAPYTPVFLESQTVKGADIGLTCVATVESLPSIASFVGADITAGLNYIQKPDGGKYNLLIDLGTNAEIVLFSENSAVCASAAAGPCFEGANISCGMSATQGAVYSCSDGEIKTVGNTAVKGICGTGLIDIIATLIKNRLIDETGFMECGKYLIAEGVYINQDDIRQYQLAKSAVKSAILTLLQIKEVPFDDIEKVYISGGFSAEINISNAVLTGLLPKEAETKCVTVNNSSLLGTVRYACEKNDLSSYVDIAENVDLSLNTLFADLFMKNMMFG